MSKLVKDSEDEIYDPEVQAKVSLLQEMINSALNQTRSNMKENRVRASQVKLTVTICSALATVFLGLQTPSLESFFRNSALALTALVTLLNALEPFFNYRALWVEHEIALWRFHRLRDRFEYYLAGQPSDMLELQELDKFHAEYQNIWDDLSLSWINYRKQEKSSTS